ncbi:uncharacterized protein BX663DRAFT_559714 [Cokeromyces recurvatus]|uniref:uncharacterized protein n=1 Tax=Cokeromyces recurvatus TaxID=90255 RepID=UPI002220E661|nr:uncharacterized protein BX663DRAFT_559714 [Cokeromyces recurvatus]KAI7904736.1 hypothetical protein BX663DRAFT_559714 [Cokeromyces recurvatus]
MSKWYNSNSLSSSTLVFLLASVQFTTAQHHSMVDEPVPLFNASGDEPMSYALFPDNKGYFYTHVILMTIAFWILMPIGIMLGIAKSSLHIPVQLGSLCFAMGGFFFAKLYGHSTPHLYKGNSHHILGWILFLFMITQMSVGIVRKIANAVGKRTASYEQIHQEDHLDYPASPTSFIDPCSSSSSNSHSSDRHSEASGETLHMNELTDFNDKSYHSKDSRQSSNSTAAHTIYDVDLDDESLIENSHLASDNMPKSTDLGFIMRLFYSVSPYIPSIVKNIFVTLAYNRFTTDVCRYFHLIMGRAFIILIFVQTLSGLVVYHGVCRSWEVLGCIAHLIKGGIFFFYGIMTFGRYLGAFANKGWAWNYIENGSRFSFEMIESCLIFTYGITNTWMEHFGQDSRWTHKDLEHASLAFMWWWCGLIGIMVESRAVRRLLERTILTNTNTTQNSSKSYSLNPFPALTVLMTGISMGNHHQDTLYSSNIHYMWGILLASAACCRFVTYLFLYRNAPTDAQPSRPPSELLGAFLLIAGSILFMASNSGTLLWLRRNNVDSMFLMNVCVALTAITLCYVAALQIIKAWAERREAFKQGERNQQNMEQQR